MAIAVIKLSLSVALIVFLICLETIIVFGKDQVLVDKQAGSQLSVGLQIRTNSSHGYGSDPIVRFVTKVKDKFKMIRKALNSDDESLVCRKLRKQYGSCDYNVVKKKILVEELHKLNLGHEVMDISSAFVANVEKLVEDFPNFQNEKKFVQNVANLNRLLNEGPPTGKPAVYSIKIIVTKSFRFVSNETRQRLLDRVEKKSTRETNNTGQNTKAKSDKEGREGLGYVALVIWIIGSLFFCTGCFFIFKCFFKSCSRLKRCCCSCFSSRQSSSGQTQNVSPIALRTMP